MDASQDQPVRPAEDRLAHMAAAIEFNGRAMDRNANSNWARAAVSLGLFLNTSGIVIAMWVFIYLYFWGSC